MNPLTYEEEEVEEEDEGDEEEDEEEEEEKKSIHQHCSSMLSLSCYNAKYYCL